MKVTIESPTRKKFSDVEIGEVFVSRIIPQVDSQRKVFIKTGDSHAFDVGGGWATPSPFGQDEIVEAVKEIVVTI